MSTTHFHTQVFKQSYGYDILVPKENRQARNNKHAQNTAKFILLLPVIGIITYVALLAGAGAFKPHNRRSFRAELAELIETPKGRAVLSLLVISGIGLGLLLLPVQLIATCMNLHDRCKEINRKKTKYQPPLDF